MVRKAINVLQVTTHNDDGDFRNPAANPRRLAVLDKALEVASRRGCHLIQLPAGFLAVGSASHWKALVADAITPRARRYAVAIAGGVDADDDRQKNPELPYYGFVVSRQGAVRVECKQRSSRNPNATDGVPATESNRVLNVQDRAVWIKGHKIALLLCGEMHNPWTRAALKSKRFSAVLVCGHEGLGQGLVPSLQAIAKSSGCDALHVQHLARGGGASFHHVAADGTDNPVRLDDQSVWQDEGWSFARRVIKG